MPSKTEREITKAITTLMPLMAKHGLPNVLMAIRGICAAWKEEFKKDGNPQEAAYWENADALLERVIKKLG